MVDVTWPKARVWIRQDEGGNDDDPDDNGGRTSRGITQHELDAWRVEKHEAHLDVWKDPDAEIDQIYHDEYWLPEGPMLPIGVDYLFVDMKVNAGPHRAIVILQKSVGVITDGRIGAVTRAAIKAADPRQLIKTYTNEKRAFYSRLAQANPHDRKFLHGWLNRCEHVLDRALSLLPAESTPNGQPTA